MLRTPLLVFVMVLSIAGCSSSGGGGVGGGAGATLSPASTGGGGAGGSVGVGGSGGDAAASSSTGISAAHCPTPAPHCLGGDDDEDINCEPSCGEIDARCQRKCDGDPPTIQLGLGKTRVRVPTAAELPKGCCQNDVVWSMLFEPPAGHCIAVYAPPTARLAVGTGAVDRCAAPPAECAGFTSDADQHRAVAVSLPLDGVPKHGSVITIEVTSAPCEPLDCSTLVYGCNGDGAP